MWSNGTIEINGSIFKYEVKHHEECSQFGIDGGRISKTTIWIGHEMVYNYDRGLDVPPADEAVEAALNLILEK